PDQVGFGVGTATQLVPSQCRASVSRPVTVGGRPELYRPTAQMSSEATTARPASSFSLVPRLGLGSWPQAACSSRAVAAPSDSNTISNADNTVRIVLGFTSPPPARRLGRVS